MSYTTCEAWFYYHWVIYLCRLTGIRVQINRILGMNQLKSECELTGYELTWVPHKQFTCITLVPPRVLNLWFWPQEWKLQGWEHPLSYRQDIYRCSTDTQIMEISPPSYFTPVTPYFRMSLYWFMAYRMRNVTFEACLFCFMAYTFVKWGTMYLERAKWLENRGISNWGKITTYQ